MNIKLIELKFDRDTTGKLPFTPENLEKLNKYVIPIIAKNRGWATEELTHENFNKDPEKWRDDIDATIEADPNASIYIAMDGEKPVGLLEYILEDFKELAEEKFSQILWDMMKDRSSKHWDRLLKYSFMDKDIVNKYFSKLQSFITSKKYYKYIGVVLIPELQGKKSGISDIMYKSMSNGILLGSTSTPQVLAKRRKLFKTTLFTPPLTQKIRTLEELAGIVIIAAMLFSKIDEPIPEEEFGIETHVGFALRDKNEYMTLAKSFFDKGKITELDYQRLDRTLNYKKGQSSVVSISE